MEGWKDYRQRQLERRLIWDVHLDGQDQLGLRPGQDNLGFWGDVWEEVAEMWMDPDAYARAHEHAQQVGPELRDDIERLNRELVTLYNTCVPLILAIREINFDYAENLMLILNSYSTREKSIYREWMTALSGYRIIVEDLEEIRDKYSALLQELGTFHARISAEARDPALVVQRAQEFEEAREPGFLERLTGVFSSIKWVLIAGAGFMIVRNISKAKKTKTEE